MVQAGSHPIAEAGHEHGAMFLPQSSDLELQEWPTPIRPTVFIG